MSSKKPDRTTLAERRALVAKYRLQGITMREIADRLQQHGHYNEETGKPYSITLVYKDLEHQHQQWRSNAMRDISDHRAETLAHYRLLLDQYWHGTLVRYKDEDGNWNAHREPNLDGVRHTLDSVRKLLGLDQPDVIIHTMLETRMDELLDALERRLDAPTYQTVTRILEQEFTETPALPNPN